MRYADRLVSAALLVLAAAIAGCATAPAPQERSPARAASPLPAETPVRADVARDYAAALIALRAGHLRDAERLFAALARANPGLSGPHANLGIVYYRSGKLEEAVAALKRAIEINPQRAAYYNELGIVYRHHGQFDRAREAYTQALALDPQYPKAHLNLGILYDLYLRSSDLALHHYSRYHELSPSAEEPVAKWIVDLKQRRQTTADRDGGNGGSG